MDEITSEQVAQHYTAMGHSIDLINAIVAGDHDETMNADERADCVSRNIEHLEIMIAKDFWTTEDMTDAASAITAGQAYVE